MASSSPAKLARILGVSADTVLGLNGPELLALPLHKRFVHRFQLIERLPRRDREALARTIDAFRKTSSDSLAACSFMDEKQRKHASKFLSKYLRHNPEDIGLSLQLGGWVPVEDLLSACARAGLLLTRPDLEEIVITSDKHRFSFDDSGLRIRANQGHSAAVDLMLTPAEPPPVLYHGTGEPSVEAILRDGLKRMERHHVHLSADVEAARAVGCRHGKPTVLAIDAARMSAEGATFYRSANGVWLVDAVPPGRLKRFSM
jgi:putative RNA 2'-phosphotransferase